MDTRPAEILVDLERYPITGAPADGGGALAGECRRRLDREGACVLDGFLRAEAVDRMLDELQPLLGAAFYCRRRHTVYLAEGDAADPPAHPRNRLLTSDKGCLADDLIPARALLRALYDWDALRAFLAAVLGAPKLYPYADPLGSLNLNVFEEGQRLGWHFDNAEFVVTLMLQAAAMGGVYEYVPGLRGPDADDSAAIARILDGGRAGVRRLRMEAGALVLFRGRHALNRVTPVRGSAPRIVAVLSYDARPGAMLTEHTRRLFYGRAA